MGETTRALRETVVVVVVGFFFFFFFFKLPIVSVSGIPLKLKERPGLKQHQICS